MPLPSARKPALVKKLTTSRCGWYWKSPPSIAVIVAFQVSGLPSRVAPRKVTFVPADGKIAAAAVVVADALAEGLAADDAGAAGAGGAMVADGTSCVEAAS